MNEFSKWKWRKWLLKLSIPNLMTYVVAGMSILYVAQMAAPALNIRYWLSLNRFGLMRGELWRLVTFIFLPPTTSVLWVVFSLYFYWMVGSALANQWGSSRFTLFYLTGMAGNAIAALIAGYADNSFLNLSLFFAFAALNPDFELMLFFFLPVKVKYLALLNAVYYLLQFIMGSWSVRLMILFALANLILFLGSDFLNMIRRESRYFKTRYNFKKAMRGR